MAFLVEISCILTYIVSFIVMARAKQFLFVLKYALGFAIIVFVLFFMVLTIPDIWYSTINMYPTASIGETQILSFSRAFSNDGNLESISHLPWIGAYIGFFIGWAIGFQRLKNENLY